MNIIMFHFYKMLIQCSYNEHLINSFHISVPLIYTSCICIGWESQVSHTHIAQDYIDYKLTCWQTEGIIPFLTLHFIYNFVLFLLLDITQSLLTLHSFHNWIFSFQAISNIFVCQMKTQRSRGMTTFQTFCDKNHTNYCSTMLTIMCHTLFWPLYNKRD